MHGFEFLNRHNAHADLCWNFVANQMSELCKNIREMKSILYGNSESEPVSEACAQLTQEFFKENTLRLLIMCLPKLNLEVIINPFFSHLLSSCLQSHLLHSGLTFCRLEKMPLKLLQICKDNKFNPS